jgi:hypothetical protein
MESRVKYTGLAEVDADGDGRITQSEWLAAGGRASEFDARRPDGSINRDRLRDLRDNHRRTHASDVAVNTAFDVLDANGDGRTTLSECSDAGGTEAEFIAISNNGFIEEADLMRVRMTSDASLRTGFDDLDTDSDGQLLLAEWLASGGTAAEFAAISHDGSIDEAHLVAARMRSDAALVTGFTVLDANNDGRISLEEYLAAGGTEAEFAAITGSEVTSTMLT